MGLTVEKEEILDAIRASGVFGASERRFDLLSYLIDQNNLGQEQSIKEMSIAIDVFNRRADFDGSIDSIVRVEMHRLRASLELFNAKNPDFSIKVPRATYKVEIEQKSSPIKKSIKKPLIWASCIAMVFLAFWGVKSGGIFTGGQEDPKSTVINEASFAPIVRIVSDDPTSKEAKSIFQQFKHQFESIVFTQIFLTINDQQSPDYTIKISNLNALDDPNAEIGVHIYAGKAGLIWSRQYPNSLVADQKSLSVFVHDLSNLTIWQDSIIPKYHATRTDIPKESQAHYACMLDMSIFLFWGKLTWHQGPDELIECSNPDNVNDNDARVLFSIHRALLYLNIYSGHYDLDIEDAYGKAEQELDSVETYSDIYPIYFTAKLVLERGRHPERDVSKLKEVVTEIQMKFSDNVPLMNDVSVTLGYFLGDWEGAKKAMAPSLARQKEGKNLSNFTLMSAALVQKDYELAHKYTKRVEETDFPIYNAILAVAYCKVGDQVGIDSVKDTLVRHNNGTKEEFRDYITKRGYAKNTQDTFVSITNDPVCSVFEKSEN